MFLLFAIAPFSSAEIFHTYFSYVLLILLIQQMFIRKENYPFHGQIIVFLSCLFYKLIIGKISPNKKSIFLPFYVDGYKSENSINNNNN